jgi:hypothetical protein
VRAVLSYFAGRHFCKLPTGQAQMFFCSCTHRLRYLIELGCKPTVVCKYRVFLETLAVLVGWDMALLERYTFYEGF